MGAKPRAKPRLLLCTVDGVPVYADSIVEHAVFGKPPGTLIVLGDGYYALSRSEREARLAAAVRKGRG